MEFNNGEFKIRSDSIVAKKELRSDMHFSKSWGVSGDPTAGFTRLC